MPVGLVANVVGVRSVADCFLIAGLPQVVLAVDDNRWKKPIIWSTADVQPLDFGGLMSEIKDPKWVIGVLILYPNSVDVNELCQLPPTSGLRC